LNKIGGYKDETKDFILLNVPHSSHVVKLLQRIRDESHRFAVSYHSSLKRSRQTKSVLEEIPGLGQVTKKKLLREFGSVRALANASESDISKVVGPVMAHKVYVFLVESNTKKS
jgi:excinuclease ABC subunit C